MLLSLLVSALATTPELVTPASAEDDEERAPASDPREWLEALVPTIGASSQVLLGTVAGGTSTTSSFFPGILPIARRFNFTTNRPEGINPGDPVTSFFPVRDQDANFRPSSSGDDVLVAPLAVLELSWMTPELLTDRAKPRIFIHGEVPLNLGADRLISIEGDPGLLQPPVSSSNTNSIPELAYSGQGSDLTLKNRRYAYSAGIGVAFRFDPFGRTIRLKPSIEWARNEYSFVGKSQRVWKPYGEQNTYTEFIQISARKRLVTNSVGPGLELELETGRVGPFTSSIFMGGRALRVIGNRRANFSGTGTGVCQVPNPLPLVNFSVTQNDPGTPVNPCTATDPATPLRFRGLAPGGRRTLAPFFRSSATNPDPLLVTDVLNSNIVGTANFNARVHSWYYNFGVGFRLDFDPE